MTGELTPDRLGPVHLVGIGGAGMSVVAVLLAARGCVVSGSDARPGPVLDALAATGVRVHVGHDAAHVEGVQTVVVSSAIRETNPELARAREAGLRVMHRSEALAVLMADRRAVAVAGAHGKTTTSAMVAVTLAHAGLDPSWAVGGAVLGWPVPGDAVPGDAEPGEAVPGDAVPGDAVPGDAVPGDASALAGARDGAGDVFVAEADESDGSFLAYRPHVAVVTNVEADHLDHYGSVAAFEAAFEDFAARVRPGGALVACADDPGARRLAAVARDGVRVLTYGTADDADVRLEDWRAEGAGSRADLVAGEERVELVLAVPGSHNALNATAAWAVARVLGVDGEVAAAGLRRFVGTGRRFEHRGTAGEVSVVDDYAHHPTEVAALLGAARAVAGDGRVLVLFQPHLYSRTAAFAEQFAEALAAADEVVVTDVYAAREEPDPAVTGALITDVMARRGAGGRFVADRHAAATQVADLARPGDLVLTVGAGDVTRLAPVVLERLAAREGGR